ncbi:hypothetical protein A3B39_03650 [Candidatus Daviesbacteria bacterium RIFCSPLOWO2_01_FULL_37_10]|nr:MAG: hypothetical protein A2111_00870 [Candidatus Daviesbacteria bacterium GWA1_38_6]OGE46073.1 MAG: hypothetical protein A3B39_03650 [Candidatus Daviesbacteria bacterium RIFCSPLOWO2_01_FULL_37_10]
MERLEEQTEQYYDAGIEILETTPDFNTILRIGIDAAKKKLRSKFPSDLDTADLEKVAGIRLIDFEESSLKRGAVMNTWGEELEIYDLPENEMAFLNGTTVKHSVLYMQRKLKGVSLDTIYIESLKAKQPQLPEGSENLAVEDLKRIKEDVSDRTASMLLAALDANLVDSK